MISVVIPVYNVEKYLDECLSSVASQSYQDWECILIDDGSTDASGEICDKWSRKDSRFKVIHQTNKGVSAARNTGIERSTGEYIVFIDSDDWVGQYYLENLYKGAQLFPGALIVSGINHVSSKNEIQEIKVNKTVHYALGDDPSVIEENIGLLYSPCAKLFSKDIIELNRIRYPEKESLGEDLVFVFRYLRTSFNICFIAVADYFYKAPEGVSLSTRDYGNRFPLHYSHWQFQCQILKENDIWSEGLEGLFANKLWGIVYEGIFMSRRLEYDTIRRILSIEDHYLLGKYADDFHCSYWIKAMVIKRRSLSLYLILLIRRHFLWISKQ